MKYTSKRASLEQAFSSVLGRNKGLSGGEAPNIFLPCYTRRFSMNRRRKRKRKQRAPQPDLQLSALKTLRAPLIPAVSSEKTELWCCFSSSLLLGFLLFFWFPLTRLVSPLLPPWPLALTRAAEPTKRPVSLPRPSPRSAPPGRGDRVLFLSLRPRNLLLSGRTPHQGRLKGVPPSSHRAAPQRKGEEEPPP